MDHAQSDRVPQGRQFAFGVLIPSPLPRCCAGTALRASGKFDELPVQPQILTELGVEAQRDSVALTHSHRPALESREHAGGSDLLDNGGADEDAWKPLALSRCQVEVSLEAVELTPIGVPSHRDVDDAEALLIRPSVRDPAGEKDGAGAGREHRETGLKHGEQRLPETGTPQEECDSRALAARDNQTIQVLQVLGQAHQPGIGAHLLEGVNVLAEVSLQCQDAHQRPCL